jgi:hypothetical protein
MNHCCNSHVKYDKNAQTRVCFTISLCSKLTMFAEILKCLKICSFLVFHFPADSPDSFKIPENDFPGHLVLSPVHILIIFRDGDDLQ